MKGNVLYSDVVHLGNIQLGIGHSIWGEGGRGKVELSEKISAFFLCELSFRNSLAS